MTLRAAIRVSETTIKEINVSDIAKHVTNDDKPGLYVTRYRNPHDGHLYVGPEIRAGGRSEAEEIAARLSYGGQPVTVDGFLVEEFPAALERDGDVTSGPLGWRLAGGAS